MIGGCSVRSTVLLLEEATAESSLRTCANGVILLEQLAPAYGSERRRLWIIKARGRTYAGGFHDFVIRKEGLEVFPRLVAAEHRAEPHQPEVLPSGIASLDALLGGGLMTGGSTLIVGPAGTGKSSIAMQFAVNAAERGGNAAVFSSDERPETAIARASGLHMNVQAHLEDGRLRFYQTDPAELTAGQFAHIVRAEVESHNVSVLVIDSLNGYLQAMPDQRFLLAQMHELLMYLGQRGVATFFVMGQSGVVGDTLSPADASYLTDNMLLLLFFEAQGKVRKAISVVSPLVFLDRDFNFVRVNQAYARIDGKSPEYFIGKNLFALYPSLKGQTIFEQVVRTRQAYRAYAEPFALPEAPQPGITYWNWWLTPLLNNVGEVQLLVLNLEDVTERQKAFFELQEQARQLQRLTLELSQTEDRERQRLAEILHDDLQQLLAAAKFHLGLLNRRITQDAPSQEIAALIKDLLQQAIGQSRSLSHELSPPALSQGDLRETFQWLAQQVQANHGLTVHLDVGGPIELESTLRSFLYKAAREMLFNVIKHAGVSAARLRLRRRCGYVCLSVSDRGRGFDTQELKKVGGAGLLGVREQIKFLGGRLKVRSTPGQGSTFFLVVPASQPQVTRAKDFTTERLARSSARHR